MSLLFIIQASLWIELTIIGMLFYSQNPRKKKCKKSKKSKEQQFMFKTIDYK